MLAKQQVCVAYCMLAIARLLIRAVQQCVATCGHHMHASACNSISALPRGRYVLAMVCKLAVMHANGPYQGPIAMHAVARWLHASFAR